MTNLPSGTVTFLFTDIEGSTTLAQKYPEEWEALQDRHHAILRSEIEKHRGHIFQVVGDSFSAAFHTPNDAVNAALNTQRALQTEAWSPAPIKVRMGIHTGEAQLREGSSDSPYTGYSTLALTQRVMSAGYGGQVLISTATHELIRDKLPKETALRDLGEKRLKDLIRPEHLYQLVFPGLIDDFPPLKTLDLYRHNLPTQLTTFIGREKEIAEVKHELSNHRLVTLTGSGGTGKTRLSLQVAAEVLDSFTHGVWFVELASLADPNLMPNTILSVLGISEQSNKPALEVLQEYLRPRQTLLVLDNCEHLIAGAARVANDILSATPNTKILASSREALGVKGELSWPVPSLSTPDPKKLPELEALTQYESVRLFIDRALLINSHFTMTKDNALAIAQICFRLDGIPLALELATARIRVLAIDQIAARLDDRFRLLTGGARTALPRQQTLRATIDWSYDLLSENERLLLRRLSVFAGGWTLEFAEQICSDQKIDSNEILDFLSTLVDKSLVIVVEEKSGRRYHMLETVRQYAREKLLESGEGEVMRSRHMDALLNFAERAEPEIRRASQRIWLDKVEGEHENLRAALEWAREQNVETCMRLTSALWRFWDLRGHNSDASEWFTQSIALSEGMRTATHAKLLSRASGFYRNTGERKKMLHPAQEASALARKLNDNTSLALSLTIEAEARLDEPEIAHSFLEEARQIIEELGDHWLACLNWLVWAELATRQNNHDLRLSCLERGLAEARLSGDHRRISGLLGVLSSYYLEQSNFVQAEQLVREAIALDEQIGDKDHVAERLAYLGEVNMFLEKYSEAETFFTETRKTFEETGNLFLAITIYCLGCLAWIRGDHKQFFELTREALKIIRHTEWLEQIATATYYHGMAAILNNDLGLARTSLFEALSVYQKQRTRWGYGMCISGFGMLALVEGKLERAAQIFGAYEQLSPSLPADMPFFVRKTREQIELVRNKLGDERFEVFAAEGKGMSLEETLGFVMSETHE